MRAKHDFTKYKRLQIENMVLRKTIETALRDLSDDECNASIRIMSAKFVIAGADREVKEEVQKYLESIKRGSR